MVDGIKKWYQEIKIPTIYACMVVYCCYLSLMPMRSDAGWLFSVVLLMFSYVASERIKKNYSFFAEEVDCWWKRVLAGSLFLYFNLSIYGLVFLEDNGFEGFPFHKIWYIPIALVWTIPLFLEIFNLVSNMVTTLEINGSREMPWKWKIAAVIILLLNYGIWLYAFNPCISSPDSAGLFYQSHVMLTVPMSNWHPPFYAMVLVVLVKIYDSVSFLIFVQCLLFAVLVVQVIDFLLSQGISKRCAAILYLVWGFAFKNTIQMITLWKDIPYMISLFWLTFLVAQYILDSVGVSHIWHIKFVLALVFVAFFRQNGILPALATALVMTVVFIFKKRYISVIAIAAFLAAIVVIEGPVYSFLKV